MARIRKRKNVVSLSDKQVDDINMMLKDKTVSNTIQNRGRLLLLLDDAHGTEYTNEQVAEAAGVCLATVTNISKLFSESGFESVMKYNRNANSDNAKRKIDGRIEAMILHIACGPVPEGHSRWTLRLLEQQARIELDVPVSKNTIGRALKKLDSTSPELVLVHPEEGRCRIRSQNGRCS